MVYRNFIALAVLAALISCSSNDLGSSESWNVANTGQPYTTAEFEVTEGTWMSVNVSPDGSTLVFDLLGDIYRIPVTGGEAELIHGGPAMQRTPSFSPDGNSILYISDASGSENLWMSGVDGSTPRQVTHETVNVLMGAAWGPAGDYVLATRLSADYADLNTADIRMFDLRGGRGRVLVDPKEAWRNVNEAKVSPSGRYLYYTERLSPPHESHVFVDANHINFGIMRKDLHTGNTEALIKGFGGATTPQLASDGKRLAFVRRVKDKTVLFVYDLETGRQYPVYDNLARDAQGEFITQGIYYPQFSWFPDNRHIAIWGKGKLYKIDTETGASEPIPFKVRSRHKITKGLRFEQDLAPSTFEVRAIRQMAIAPDEQSMVFHALGHLWKNATLSDGEPARLTNASALEFEPAYSPDGGTIAYVEWADEEGSSLKLASSDGQHLQTLAHSEGVIRQPAFSLEGDRLVYHIEQPEKCMGGYGVAPGIYWLSLDGEEKGALRLEGTSPQFSPDGQRIYYTTSVYEQGALKEKLESVDLRGRDKRVHAYTTDADTLELRISPDLNWIAFKEHDQYYLLRYRETGSALRVSATSEAVPVRQLTSAGGNALTWSADSTLYWALGSMLYRTSVTEPFTLGAVSAPYTTIKLEVSSDVPEGVVAFTNGRIITMQGDQVIEQGTLVVRGNRILAVGETAAVAIPDDAQIIDISGKTLMPGWVDMHGHLENCYYSAGGLMPEKSASHYAALAYGITTNYDPYASEIPSYAASEMKQAGVTVGPRQISVGNPVFGRPGKADSVFVGIDNYEDALRVMASKRAMGGTIIKSYRQPMRSQRQQLIKAGREAGVMVDGEGESHFYNNITMILDGHTNLQHNMPVATYYDDLVQLMAHGDTGHTPTLVVTFGELSGENYIYQNERTWEDARLQSYVPEITSSYSPIGAPHSAPTHVRGMTTLHAADELWDIGFRAVAKSMKRLDDAGVVITAGSHSQVPGLAMHWEMRLLKEGGMSNMRVLRAGTINGAQTLGLQTQIGSLEEGKLADLIVLDENPLEDIRATSTVRYTMVNGRLYDTTTMNEIGNYDRPRSRFFWEADNNNGIDWNESWSRQ